ncbi:MAG: vitamin K epoxide reductase family protein [Wenzhouxiangellaceae bacterium]|nr:vitamin K epoxide reductase family protein [Wenzhouxiangellaceae bacterium]
MSRKHKPRHSRPQPAAAPAKHKLEPDVPVSILAALGLLLTGYLGFVAYGSEAPLFCGPESGCSIVQNSSYATLLGLPVALWGFGLYALILWSAVTLPPRLKRWNRLAWLTGLGFAISVYFTLTGIVQLDATCGWCLTSAALMTALFVTVMLRRPESAPGIPWPVFGRNLVLGTGFVVALLFAWQNGLLQPPEDPRLKALATHLEETGAKYYGAFWCPNCQRQSRMFGRSADRLPYVECTPNGRGGVTAFECVANDITGYPTWIIDGRRFQGVLSPDELARHSGFVFREDQDDN